MADPTRLACSEARTMLRVSQTVTNTSSAPAVIDGTREGRPLGALLCKVAAGERVMFKKLLIAAVLALSVMTTPGIARVMRHWV